MLRRSQIIMPTAQILYLAKRDFLATFEATSDVTSMNNEKPVKNELG